MEQKSSLGLLLQRLSVDDRLLAVCSVAAASTENRSFTASDALTIFDKLWIPRPSNIHATLASLERQRFVRRAAVKRRWGITPLGREGVRAILADINPAAIDVELRGAFGADFLHTRHSLVTPAFAPVKWLQPIGRLLSQFPFEQNVFLMTRFPESATDKHYLDPIRDVFPLLRSALSDHGLILHLASERQLDDDLLSNVAAHMWACNYGIGILEDRVGRGLNYNVITEVGAMLMTGRRCALMKDVSVPKLPSDLAGQIYKSIDLSRLEETVATAHTWAATDIGLGRCANCAPLES
jgi:hypothetical protein